MEPERIGTIIERLFEQDGLGERLTAGYIWKYWDSVLQEEITSLGRPVKYGRGRLEVEVDTPSAGHQLAFFNNEICEKLNEALGEDLIQTVHVKVGKKKLKGC